MKLRLKQKSKILNKTINCILSIRIIKIIYNILGRQEFLCFYLNIILNCKPLHFLKLSVFISKSELHSQSKAFQCIGEPYRGNKLVENNYILYR